MTYRSVGVVAAIVFGSIAVAEPARAECVMVLGKQLLDGRDVVFSGTVVNITRIGEAGYRATFEVDRVWKGSVSKRFDLYVWGRNAEMPRFEVGKQYLARANKLTDRDVRRALGLPDGEPVAFRAGLCTGEHSATPEILKHMGPGAAPKDTAVPDATSAFAFLNFREPKVAWNARNLLKGDFDYDGTEDYALGGRKERLYVVAIVKGPVSAQAKHWTLEFAEGQYQDSLCSVDAARIEIERLHPEEVEGARELPRGSRGINLSDGLCDSFHIHWDRKDKRFVWWRL